MPPPGHGHPPLGARNSGPWQDGFGSVASRGSRSHVSPGRSHASHVSHVSPARDAGARSHSRGSKPALVIPRAKVTPSRGHTNNGYNSDTDDRFSQETQVRKTRILGTIGNSLSFRRTEQCLRLSPRAAGTGGGQFPRSPPRCWEGGAGGRAVWIPCSRDSRVTAGTPGGETATPPSTGACPGGTLTPWTGRQLCR